jgi:hypothetical protein
MQSLPPRPDDLQLVLIGSRQTGSMRQMAATSQTEAADAELAERSGADLIEERRAQDAERQRRKRAGARASQISCLENQGLWHTTIDSTRLKMPPQEYIKQWYYPLLRAASI